MPVQIDMEMPASCTECLLKYEATEGGAEYCCLTDTAVYGIKDARLPECPLMET